MGATKLGIQTHLFWAIPFLAVSGAVISAIPQDLKFDGENTLAIIGDNTIIRECATINRATKATGKTIVGNNCLIMAYAHIAHDCVVGNNNIFANNAEQMIFEKCNSIKPLD